MATVVNHRNSSKALYFWACTASAKTNEDRSLMIRRAIPRGLRRTEDGRSRLSDAKKTPPKELFASEALAVTKIAYGDQ